MAQRMSENIRCKLQVSQRRWELADHSSEFHSSMKRRKRRKGGNVGKLVAINAVKSKKAGDEISRSRDRNVTRSGRGGSL